MDEERRGGCGWIFRAAVLAACLNGVAVGNLAGWPQAAIPQLLSPTNRLLLSESQVSWIAGIFFLGMLLGGFAALPLAARYGKRRLFLLASVPLLLGWSVLAVAESFWHYIAARTILGLGGGMICHQTEMYLSEISPPYQRSRISVVYCACIHVGVLLSFAVAPHLGISSATAVYLGFVLALLALFSFAAPETPFWLVKSGRKDEAMHALRKLRGSDASEEFVGIVEFVTTAAGETSEGLRRSCGRVFGSRADRKAVMLVVLLTTAQQFSGMAALSSYAQLIFERTNSSIPGRYVSLLMGLIELCCTGFSGLLIERVGRRKLVATSTTVCSISMATLGFHFQTASSSDALAMGCIVAFALAYGLGLATVATVIAAECLSMDARNFGAAAQNTTLCLTVFFITKVWQAISSAYGQQYSFWVASAVTALHACVLLIVLPETRGKSLTEIQRLLAGSTTTRRSGDEKSDTLLAAVDEATMSGVKIVPAQDCNGNR